MVSIDESKRAFIPAIWNSYSAVLPTFNFPSNEGIAISDLWAANGTFNNSHFRITVDGVVVLDIRWDINKWGHHFPLKPPLIVRLERCLEMEMPPSMSTLYLDT